MPSLTAWMPGLLFTPTVKEPAWRYLPHWLFIAFVLRAYIALAGNFILHPDEILQYLEPAHRLVFGYGIISWEYYYGSRSWLVPGFVASILWVLDQFGLGFPAVYVYVVKLVFCLLALFIPWGIYHYARLIVAEQAARLALILACLWPFLVVFAHKPFTEFVATNLLCAAFGLASLSVSQSKRGAFALGALLALVAAVRMQYLPLAGLLWLARAIPMNRSWIITSILGGLMTLFLVGLLETFTWGYPFHSYHYNLVFNYLFDELRQLKPWDFYLLRLLFATSGGILIMLWACYQQPRRYLLLLIMLLVVVLLHNFQLHKEFRFIFVVYALWLIPFCGQLHYWASAVNPRKLLNWTTTAAALICVLGISNVFEKGWLHPRKQFIGGNEIRYIWQQNNLTEIFLGLAQRQDVKGVIVTTDFYYNLPGYYYLHHQVPLYGKSLYNIALQQNLLTTNLATHVIGSPKLPVTGFVQEQTIGTYALNTLAQEHEIIQWQDYTPTYIEDFVAKYAHTYLGESASHRPIIKFK